MPPADPEPPAEAPFGYLADGVTPRKSRAGRPAGSGRKARPRNRAKTPSAPPRKPTSTRPPTARSASDYRPGFATIFTMAAGFLTMGPPAYQADGAALYVLAEDLADGLHEVAQERPEIRKLAEWAAEAGPYAKLAQACGKLAAQVAQNHRPELAAVTMKFGAVPPEMLHAQYEAKVRADLAAQGINLDDLIHREARADAAATAARYDVAQPYANVG